MENNYMKNIQIIVLKKKSKIKLIKQNKYLKKNTTVN